jgi:hypothetical protein
VGGACFKVYIFCLDGNSSIAINWKPDGGGNEGNVHQKWSKFRESFELCQ